MRVNLEYLLSAPGMSPFSGLFGDEDNQIKIGTIIWNINSQYSE